MFLSNRLILFVVGALLFCAAQLHAQLSPGELSQAHSFLEGLDNCRKCHGADRKEIGSNCLECHKFIRDEIAAKSGMHGGNAYTQCEMCHVEHQGRDFDLVYWPDGMTKFDHKDAGWQLTGKHARIECRKCHRPENIKTPEPLLEAKKKLDRTFMGLSTDCASCHFDEHRGQLSSDCQKCHTPDGWKPTTGFDHQQTKFTLTGLHQKVECIKCHPMESDASTTADTSFQKFTGLQFGACTDCHRDAHDGRLGSNCTGCHTTAGWRNVQSDKFDHDKTRYPLRGRHVGIACDKCHGAERKEMPRFAKCTDCHADFHNGEFAQRLDGGACESCHSVQGFRPANFTVSEHDSTAFPLVGAHLAVACDQCHVKSGKSGGKAHYQFRFAEQKCTTCHQNPHQTHVDKWLAKNGCETCHNQESWQMSVFNHDLTEFALSGGHKRVLCRNCHWNSTNEFRVEELDFKSEKRLCQNCHRDVHAGQFATAGETSCNKCHSAAAWSALLFDHNRDSRFKLDGAHIKVPCAGCHHRETEESTALVRYKPLGTDCKDCHNNTELEPRERKPF